MKKLFKYIPILLATWLIVACQNNDEADFKNKAFIDGKTFTAETIIKGAGSMVKSLTLSTSRPAEKDLNADFQRQPLRWLILIIKLTITRLSYCQIAVTVSLWVM